MICGLLGFGMVGGSQVVWLWVSWVADGCGRGWVLGGVAMGFIGCRWVWPWVSGGSQVRFRGLQMGVVMGLRCVWNGSQRVHDG